MYLSVQPLGDDRSDWGEIPWGWDVRLRDRQGVEKHSSGAFGHVGEATDFARLASALIARHGPLQAHFDDPPPTTPEGGATTVVRRVPADDSPGWRITATRPGGAAVAHSRPMSEVGAYNALRFLEASAESASGRRLPLRITSSCWCGPADSCRHYNVAPFGRGGPDLPERYLAVEPDYEASAWWQVVAREDDDAPELVRSLQVPSRADASALAAFVASVTDHPGAVLYHTPAEPHPIFDPDDNPDDFVLVDVGQVDQGWQLQANTPDGPLADGPTFPSLTSARQAATFVERAVMCFPIVGERLPLTPRIELHQDCACGAERRICRHYGNLPELPIDPSPAPPGRAVTLGIYVRPYHRDNHGWEVVTTEPDGSPWQTTGPYQTAYEAEQARDFMALVVNAHPKLHILGWDPQWQGDAADSYTQPPRDQAPTVGISAVAVDGPWYVQCRTPDGTVAAASPPYPTYRAADEALDQIGTLVTAKAGCVIDREFERIAAAHCPCSSAGWRCDHIEDHRTVQTATPERGGLSL